MHDCTMTLAQATGVYGVYYVSSGGLRLTDLKINGGQVGLNMQLASGALTGDLIVTGASYENQQINFFLQRAGTTGSFSNIVTAACRLVLSGRRWVLSSNPDEHHARKRRNGGAPLAQVRRDQWNGVLQRWR